MEINRRVVAGWTIVLSVALLLTLVPMARMRAEPAGTARVTASDTGYVTIQVANRAELPGVVARVLEAGLGVAGTLEPLPILMVAAGRGEERRVIEQVRAWPSVVAAEQSAPVRSLLTPNDPLFREYQRDLRRLEMESVWELSLGDPSIIVAVLDTGVDRTHPDLAPNLLSGYDFVNDDSDPSDDGTHGTHVAGIIAAVANNAEGISGMAPRSRVLPVKVLDAHGLGVDSVVAKGIIYAVEQGASIINVSSGTFFPSLALKEAVEFADRRGSLVVAAAGNSGERDNSVIFPAAYPQVLAVGALNDRDQPAAFSQRHSYVAISAPGVDIASTIWRAGNDGIGYGSNTGTSAAAPHVSALGALIWAADPRLTKQDVRRIILDTADDVGQAGRDDATGMGRINPMRALRSIDASVRRPVTAPRTAPEQAQSTTITAQSAPLRTVPVPAFESPSLVGPRQWFFADGRTRDNAETRVVFFNPSDATVTGKIIFNTSDGRIHQQPVRVEPFGRSTIWANDYVPESDFSIRIDADETLYVERTVLFGHDASTLAAARGPSTTWYFAEGAANDTYESLLVITNLEKRTAQISIRTFTEQGPQPEFPITLPEGGRVTLEQSPVQGDGTFSTIVSSDVPVLVERGVYFDGGRGGDANSGSKGLSRTWYFAEGDTRGDFNTRIALFNPNAEMARIKVQIIRTDRGPMEHLISVPGFSRRTLKLDDIEPNAQFALRLEADVAFAAERSIFVGGGGHIASGVTQPATEWFLAEGDTIPPFAQFISLLNPTDQEVRVELTFFPDGPGGPKSQVLRLRPLSRGTVDVGKIVPNVRSSARILADKAIVVERTLYYEDLRGGTSGPAMTK